jgi:hypothetical protein
MASRINVAGPLNAQLENLLRLRPRSVPYHTKHQFPFFVTGILLVVMLNVVRSLLLFQVYTAGPLSEPHRKRRTFEDPSKRYDALRIRITGSDMVF